MQTLRTASQTWHQLLTSFGAMLGTTVAGLASFAIAARILGFTDLGDFATLVAIVTIVAALSKFGMDRVLTLDNVHRRQNGSERLETDTVAVAALTATASGLAAAAIAMVLLSLGEEDIVVRFIAVTLWVIAEVLRAILVELLRVEGNFAVASAHAQVVRNLAAVALLTLLWRAGGFGLTAVIVASSSASVVATLVATKPVLQLRLLGWRGKPDLAKRVLRTYRRGLPFFVSGVASMILLQGDVVVARTLGNADAASAYAVGLRLSMIVSLPFFAMTALVPRLAVPALHEGSLTSIEREIRRLTFACTCLGLAGLAVIVVFGSRLVTLVAGTESQEAWRVGVILAAGLLANVFTGPAGELLSVAGLPRVLVLCNVGALSAIAVMVALLALTSTFSPALLAATFAVGMVGQNLALAILTRHFTGVLPIGIPMRRGVLAERGGGAR